MNVADTVSALLDAGSFRFSRSGWSGAPGTGTRDPGFGGAGVLDAAAGVAFETDAAWAHGDATMIHTPRAVFSAEADGAVMQITPTNERRDIDASHPLWPVLICLGAPASALAADDTSGTGASASFAASLEAARARSPFPIGTPPSRPRNGLVPCQAALGPDGQIREVSVTWPERRTLLFGPRSLARSALRLETRHYWDVLTVSDPGCPVPVLPSPVARALAG
ncbi:MAG: hypothetical protein U0R70_00020 [Solirubrobacteraceae bacterium]